MLISVPPKSKTDLVLELFKAGVIKFGQFNLKFNDKNSKALPSPVYLDFGALLSSPEVMQEIISWVWLKIIKENMTFDFLSDVPTGSTPIVSVLSINHRIPMISPKISQAHGLTGEIKGIYSKGQRVVIIDDVLTKGTSIKEIALILRKNGLIVENAIVAIDREQGGKQALEEAGINCSSLLGFPKMLEILLSYNKISQEKYREIITYLKAN